MRRIKLVLLSFSLLIGCSTFKGGEYILGLPFETLSRTSIVSSVLTSYKLKYKKFPLDYIELKLFLSSGEYICTNNIAVFDSFYKKIKLIDASEKSQKLYFSLKPFIYDSLDVVESTGNLLITPNENDSSFNYEANIFDIKIKSEDDSITVVNNVFLKGNVKLTCNK